MSNTDFILASEVQLARGEPMPRSNSYEERVNECWQRAAAQNPDLFNGPMVSALGGHVTGDMCRLRWCHSDYAHYMYSRQNLAPHEDAPIGTIFVSLILPISNDAFVIGRMSGHTSTPCVVQLPGGGISVDPRRAEITYGDITATAIDEVREELGIDLKRTSLRCTGIISREVPPDVGIVFTTEPYSWYDVVSAFSLLQEHGRSVGAKSEFSELMTLDVSRNVPLSDDSYVDYLPALVEVLRVNQGGIR